jgi:molybdenum-dependent DNA-binding transcriptional regulator ModE
MKKLPDEKVLLEMLEQFKDAEQAAREMCEMSTRMAWKYQKRMQEIRKARQEQVSQVE